MLLSCLTRGRAVVCLLFATALFAQEAPADAWAAPPPAVAAADTTAARQGGTATA
ncbi:MAG: hypothetical protein IH626_22365, partial [Rhodospirillales bacterium]|nr:hypothetical protein [Rhodospirillales bacterium]